MNLKLMYSNFFKRFFDLLFSFTALIFTSPIIFITATLLWFTQKDVFFFQRRPGKGGEIFKIIKFKTMNDKKDAHGKLLSDAERLTSFGKFIRKTSIDELPQLLNVLKGEMSLVGPRPLLTEYLHLYNDSQKRRHEVRPGITGWSQVNGRNSLSWNEKFELDVWYVDNRGFLLDIKILWLTIYKVIKSEGITQGDKATVEVFKGNIC